MTEPLQPGATPPSETPGLIGAAVRRVEDDRLLRGEGSYTDDLLPEAAEAAFVRSDHAHALVVGVDASAAENVEGVLGVFTYEDLDGLLAEPLPFLNSPALIAPRTQHALARGEVCYQGEAVAMVVARDRYAAEDGASAIRVDYEILPAVADLAQAALPGAPSVHMDMADNVAARRAASVGDVDGALAAASHAFTLRLEVERSAAMPMEGRALAAVFDHRGRRLLVYESTQVPMGVKAGLARLLGLPPENVDVVAPDIGGGFGVKSMQFYPEEVLVPWAAMRLGTPVKWTEDRREQFIGSNHERKQIHDVRVGASDDGTIVALETRYLHDAGAYTPYGMIVPTVTSFHVPGPYRIENYRYEYRAIYTNALPTSPYRGAGRPEATYVMERVIDHVAAALVLDRAAVRRANFLQPRDFPYTLGLPTQEGTVARYDSGDYPRAFEMLLEALDYAAFPDIREEARREGRLLGLGLGCYVEQTGIGPFEGAVVSIEDDGVVSVATGATSLGQGLETALAQIAAEAIGVPLEGVRVTTGDTRRIGRGVGTYASRSAVVGGNAVLRAAGEVRRQAAALAADALEVDPSDLVFEDGFVRVAGSEKGLSLTEVAALADPLRYVVGAAGPFTSSAETLRSPDRPPLPEGRRPGLVAEEYYSPPSGVFSFGMHGAIVEVDPDTFDIRFHRYVVVHDCGRVINPMIVEGQVLGGVAQGVGGAFYERMAYSPEGQLQNASFMDFLIPYATEVPWVEILHTETPSPLNPLGVKGAGEGGVIPVSATVAGALEDALGVPITRMPMSPSELHELFTGTARSPL